MLSSPSGNAILKGAEPVLGRVVNIMNEMRSFNQDFSEGLELTLRLLHAFARGEYNARGLLDPNTTDKVLLNIVTGHSSQDDDLASAIQSLRAFRKGACSSIECPPSSDTKHARLCNQCQVVRFCDEKVPTSHFHVFERELMWPPVSECCVETQDLPSQGPLQKYNCPSRSAWP